jgi:hypothetical protein
MEKWLLMPVFVQILLTSVVMILMGRRRIRAAKNKDISVTVKELRLVLASDCAQLLRCKT